MNNSTPPPPPPLKKKLSKASIAAIVFVSLFVLVVVIVIIVVAVQQARRAQTGEGLDDDELVFPWACGLQGKYLVDSQEIAPGIVFLHNCLKTDQCRQLVKNVLRNEPQNKVQMKKIMSNFNLSQDTEYSFLTIPADRSTPMKIPLDGCFRAVFVFLNDVPSQLVLKGYSSQGAAVGKHGCAVAMEQIPSREVRLCGWVCPDAESTAQLLVLRWFGKPEKKKKAVPTVE